MMRRSALILILPLLSLALLGSEADDHVDYVSGQVIVTRAPFASANGLSALGYKTLEDPAGVDYEVVATRPGQSVQAAVEELSSRGDVIAVQPNYIYRALRTVPNDPRVNNQYYLSLIGAFDAWDISRGSASETIAIADSGVDTDHVDLDTRIKTVAGGDVVEGDSDVSDATGHGTGIAGISAAKTNNGTAVAGIDWFSNLLPVRVLSGPTDTGTSAQIDSGIRLAIQHKATVINLSLGFSSSAIDPLIEARLQEAFNAGIIVVAAAGNSAGAAPIYPASSQFAIPVGSSNSSDARSSFSNKGAGIIMAPGDGIVQLALNNGTTTASGTSFSTPIITGAAALVRALRPGLSPTRFFNFLKMTATDIGDAGIDDATGFGRINLLRLLQVATANTNYSDSLSNFTAATTAVIVGGGRQGKAGLPITAVDSYAGYFQRHGLLRGTIQFYWRPDAAPPAGETRLIVTQTGNNLKLVYQSDKKIEYRIGTSSVTSKTALNLNQWYHVALVYGDSMHLYINGDSEISRAALATAPAFTDSIYLGSPAVHGTPAFGRFSQLSFSDSALFHFPSALFIKVEKPVTATSEVGTTNVSTKSYETETNGITVDVYADVDQADFNGTLLASNVASLQAVSLASLTIGQSYFLYAVATDTSITTEKAYAYASAAITPAAPGAVTVSGSAGAAGGPCLIARVAPRLGIDPTWARRLRDDLMNSNFGRFSTAAYYALFG